MGCLRQWDLEAPLFGIQGGTLCMTSWPIRWDPPPRGPVGLLGPTACSVGHLAPCSDLSSSTLACGLLLGISFYNKSRMLLIKSLSRVDECCGHLQWIHHRSQLFHQQTPPTFPSHPLNKTAHRKIQGLKNKKGEIVCITHHLLPYWISITY